MKRGNCGNCGKEIIARRLGEAFRHIENGSEVCDLEAYVQGTSALRDPEGNLWKRAYPRSERNIEVAQAQDS